MLHKKCWDQHSATTLSSTMILEHARNLSKDEWVVICPESMKSSKERTLKEIQGLWCWALGKRVECRMWSDHNSFMTNPLSLAPGLPLQISETEYGVRRSHIRIQLLLLTLSIYVLLGNLLNDIWASVLPGFTGGVSMILCIIKRFHALT